MTTIQAADANVYDARYLDGYRDTLWGYEYARWVALHHFLQKVVNTTAAQHVLDYGAGNGLHVDLWQLLYPNAELSFCDISPIANEQLATRYPEYRDTTKLIADDHVDFPDNSFDVILSVEVMEHVADLEAYVSEVNRLLKPGGVFVWTTPCGNRGSIEHIYNVITRQIDATPEGYRRWRWEDDTHVRRLRTTEIDPILHSNGYSEVGFRWRAHLFSFISTRFFLDKYPKFGQWLLLQDYRWLRRLSNGASMVGYARK